jgi:hypothetical protein
VAKTHIVVKGETLSALAQRYYGEPRLHPVLAAANRISDPDKTQPGQVGKSARQAADAARPVVDRSERDAGVIGYHLRTDSLTLGLRNDGRDSWIYRMQPFPHRLGPASPARLRAAVLSDPGAIGGGAT